MKEDILVKSDKSDESNRKRLESLKQQADEFKLKKSFIKNSLNNNLVNLKRINPRVSKIDVFKVDFFFHNRTQSPKK